MSNARRTAVIENIVASASRLRDAVSDLNFGPQVPWIYNPLEYAWQAHRQYIGGYVGLESQKILFLGMNPGPWGMAQTGVPFGEVTVVRKWLKIDAPIERPHREHPKRPIDGLACKRSEVSGQRLWGLFQTRFKTTDKFFRHHFVSNYCPLVFMEQAARNVTPDKLSGTAKSKLFELCDEHLRTTVSELDLEWIVGIGAFAENCALRVAPNHVRVGRILHPSPASPQANRNWAETATGQMIELGLWKAVGSAIN